MKINDRNGFLWRNKAAVLLFLVALLVRGIYLLEIQANHSPDMYSPLDQMENRYWARTILTGDLLGREAAFPEDVFYRNQVFFKPPLYPYLLALLLGIGGGSLVFVAAVQAVVSSLACALVHPLARRLGFGSAVGLVAGFALALCGPHVFNSGQLLSETAYTTLGLVLLLALQAFRETPTLWRALGAGLLLGACTLLRPNVLALVPFVAVWLWVVLRREHGTMRLVRWAAVGLAGLAICILPVTVRNAAVGGDTVLLGYYGGYNFFVGNNAECRHGTANHDMPRYHKEINRETERRGRPLKASEISAIAWRMGFAEIRERPGRLAVVALNKFYRSFNSYEMVSNQSPEHMARYSKVLGALVWRAGPFGFPMGLWGPLGLLGLAVAVARRRGALGILFVGASVVGLLAFFVTFRHRLPMLPVLYVFAGYGAVVLVKELRARSRTAIVLVVALAALVFLTNSNLDGLETERYERTVRSQLVNSYLNQAAAACETGDYDGAAAVLKRSLEETPENTARISLAFLLAAHPDLAARDGAAARHLLAGDLGRLGSTFEFHVTRAFVLAETGEYAAAAAAMEAVRGGFAGRGDVERAAFSGRLARHFARGGICRLAAARVDVDLRRKYGPKWEVHLPPWNFPHPIRPATDIFELVGEE